MPTTVRLRNRKRLLGGPAGSGSGGGGSPGDGAQQGGDTGATSTVGVAGSMVNGLNNRFTGKALFLGPNDANSSIGASPSTLVDDNSTTTTIQFVVLNVLGNAISGSVVTASTDANATLGSIAATNINGVTSCTFKCATTGAHVVTWTADSIKMTTTATVTGVAASAPDTTSTLALSANSVASGSPITATVQAKNSNTNITVGGATVVLSAAGGTSTVSIGGTVDNGDGTYSITITGTGAGTATTISGTINGNALTASGSLALTVTSGSGNPTPDILNNASFEGSSWNGFTNWSYGTPSATSPRTIAFDTTDATPSGGGSVSVKTTIVPTTPGNDRGTQFMYPFNHIGFAKQDRLHYRFYFKFLSNVTPDGTWKFNILEGGSGLASQFAGIYCIAGAIRWVFPEWLNANASTYWTLATYASVKDGNWHRFEVDYIRNGHSSGNPAVGVWFDNAQITTGSLPTNYTAVASAGAGPFTATRDGYNYVEAGSRVNGPTSSGFPLSADKFQTVELGGVLNGSPANSTTGDVLFDLVSISTLGMIDGSGGAP